MEVRKVEGLTRMHLPRLFAAMGLHRVLLLGTHRGEFAYRWLHDDPVAKLLMVDPLDNRYRADGMGDIELCLQHFGDRASFSRRVITDAVIELRNDRELFDVIYVDMQCVVITPDMVDLVADPGVFCGYGVKTPKMISYYRIDEVEQIADGRADTIYTTVEPWYSWWFWPRREAVVKLPAMTRQDFPKLIDALGIKRGVEVGTERGWFASWLLDNSGLDELWCVDPYYCPGRTINKENASTLLHRYGSRCRRVMVPSVDAARQAAAQDVKFGFIYIDGNHSAECVREDVEAWWPLMDRPGVFSGHDFMTMKRTRCHVEEIVREFQGKVQVPCYATGERWASWFFIV